MRAVAAEQQRQRLLAHAALGAALDAVAPQERERHTQLRHVHVHLNIHLIYYNITYEQFMDI